MGAAAAPIGIGLQVGQGVGSAIKGHQASNQLSQNMGMTNQLFQGMAGQAGDVMNLLSGAARSFQDPRVPASSFLSPAVPSTRTAPTTSTTGVASVGGMLDFSRAPGSVEVAPNPRAGIPSGNTLSDVILRDAFQGAGQLAQTYQAGAAGLQNRGLANQAAGLVQQGGMGGLLANVAQGGGFQSFQPGQVFQGNQFTPLGILTPQASGGNVPMHAPSQVNLSPVHAGTPFTANQFAFDPVAATRQQAIDFSMQAGDRARATAQEQAALAMQQGAGGIDKMLAARGMSADSGVGAAALAQLGAATGQQMADLNRDLASQGQQAALQASQFDVGSLLDLAGMGSQYNLGINQLTGQLGLGRDQMIAGQLDARNALAAQLGISGDQLMAQQLMAGNQLGLQADQLVAQQRMAQNELMGNLGLARDQMTVEQLMQNTQLGAQFGLQANDLLANLAQAGQANDLARSQQLAALQGLQDQSVLSQTDLLARGVTDPISMMQGIYTQNYLAPQMELLGLQSGLAGQLAGLGVQGLMGNQAAMAQAVQAAGSGKGAATAGATRPGKGGSKGATTAPTPSPLFSVSSGGL